MSVEDAVACVKQLNRGDPLPERLLRALHHFDSRAVALLLKDLSKTGLDQRASELFDWLRALPDHHPLKAVCDVYT
jgi:pentatricopeptide repeat domain-containing protein 1